MIAGIPALLDQAARVCSGDQEVLERLQQIGDRYDGTLRIALAGMVESGKSTLLNAVLGKELAATDASEITQLVTWYRYRRAPRITVHLVGGMRLIRPFTRDGDRVLFDLAGHSPEEIDRLVVDWPAEALKTVTIIDTPGIGSVSRAISGRTESALLPPHGAPDADAVIYLMRHVHEEDVRFLTALSDGAGGAQGGAHGGAAAVGVLSRADEVGGGRVDSLLSARAIADRYRNEPEVSRLVSGVLPVAGLLAQAARSLQEAEFGWLARIAGVERSERAALLFSVGRFLGHRGDAVLEVGTRQRLLDRFGLYGIRIAAVLIDGGIAHARDLADELARGSGFERFLSFVDEQYLQRAEQLKVSSALGALADLVRERPLVDRTHELSEAIERMRGAEAQGWDELRLLAELRSIRYPLGADERAEARRLLGGDGLQATQRLGLPAGAGEAEIVRSAADAAARWRSFATKAGSDHSSLTAVAGARLGDTVARSAERLLFGRSGATRSGRLRLLAPEPRPGAGQETDDERHAG